MDEVKHLYVSIPPESARLMWRNYAIREFGHEQNAWRVDFIPAQGGCVVVTMQAPLQSWISHPLQRLRSGSRVAGEQVLARFQDYLDHLPPRPSVPVRAVPNFIRLPH